MHLRSPLRLLLLGAPGSGKGTQTSKLLRLIPDLNTLSSGDTLRVEMASGSALGEQAAQYIQEGKLVPDLVMVGLVTNQLLLQKWLDNDRSWLLDGFPRTRAQAQKLDDTLSKHKARLNLVVELDVDQSKILERIEARWVHTLLGRVYNLDYNPPKVAYKDDVTGEALSKRSDDTAEVFQKRLDQYNDMIGPLREYYSDQGVFEKVAGATSDEIFPRLEALVKKFA